MKKQIYLDSASTTKPSDEVLEFLSVAMKNSYGNPDSMHALGLDAEKQVEHARNIIASSINAKPEEIIFTSSGTEANNLAIFGSVEALKRRGNKIITTNAEHPSVYFPMLELEKKGFDIIYLSTKEGKINIDEFKNYIDEKVILISIMLVNNETGSIFDISEIIKTVENSGFRDKLYIHCDAVQAFCKIPIDLNKLKIDMMSISAHKIHGIKGCGALFLRKNKRIIPQIFGGGQENNLRSSTLNTPGIFAFGKAVEEAAKDFQKNHEYINKLYDYTVIKIKEKCPEIIFNQRADINNISKYILSLRLPKIKSEVMLNYFSGQGIYISSGSACSEKHQNSKESKRVLLNYGLDKNSADFTIRVSFSKYNTFDETEEFVNTLSDGIKKLIVSQIKFS
ncbi:MAG: cysteine desulfurase [Oscillospiraceae bacterium]|nr:cysteine desulfurase [Oscillospiraceae bacterium]